MKALRPQPELALVFLALFSHPPEDPVEPVSDLVAGERPG